MLPVLEQLPPGRLHRRGAGQVAPHRPVQDVGPLEVAGSSNPPPLDRLGRPLAGHRGQLVERPHVELALHPLGVGVLG